MKTSCENVLCSLYAELPSRDVLIAKLLYLMMYPISGLAVVLEGIRKQKAGE